MSSLPPTLGNRYRVTRALGKGGMGSVAEVVDGATGSSVALKALRHEKQGSERDRAARLFEQEYHTLSQLNHPRVVEVYDFHKDDQGAFYTMELLDGGDLRALSPMPWRRACEVLCDVCSALSLLHSRRLVHRDLTTRNVRCTKDGKAKLIDFGAMSPFGPNRHIVGTPSFTAPEVLTAQALDARTDLFSLGATAYYALTGRHAFPAPSFNALRNVWRSRPAPPSRHAPDVPKELDDLVMSLLQLAPVARPRTAAEVMERLSVIAGVQLDEQLVTRQAYLSTPTLVGRHGPLLRVRKQMLRTTRGRGGAFVVVGPPGVGRSRFLDACVLEAKLLGAAVVRAFATDGSAGDWGGVAAMLRQLEEAFPNLPPAPILPAPDRRSQAPGRSEGPESSRGQLQTSLCRHFISAIQSKALVLAIDDFDRLDEPSAALVALLANAADGRAMCVMASALDRPDSESGQALKLLRKVSSEIEIEHLSRDDAGQLLRSVFGDVPNLELLADRLYAIAGGCPRTVMQLAQHLLDTETVVYQAGTWILPSKLDPSDLPASLGEALRARVGKLQPHALTLAHGIAIAERASLTFSECQLLCPDYETARVLSALDELVAAEILSVDTERYALTQPGWIPVLTERLDDEVRRVLHERLAGVCEQAGDEPLVLQHLFRAGRRDDARERFLRTCEAERQLAADDIIHLLEILRAQPPQWREVLEGLLDDCQRLERPRWEATSLRLAISLRAIATSQRSEAHFLALFDELYHDSGLDLYDELDEGLEPTERLHIAVERATARHEAAEERERGLPPLLAIRDFGVACAMAVPLAGRSFDREFLERIPRLSAFAPLSPMLWLSDASARSTHDLCCGRTERAREGYLALLSGYRDRAGAPMEQRIHYGFTYAIGVLEAGIGIRSALERADAVESEPAFAIGAACIRMLHALRQGDFEGAEQHARRVELLQLQGAPPSAYEGSHLTIELRSYAEAGDMARLKQLMPKIDAMAALFSTWSPFVHYARGRYHLLRRGADAALQEFEQGLELAQPGHHLAWPLLTGSRLDALNLLGRHREVAEQGEQLLEIARREGLRHQAGFIERAVALAEAAGERFDRAIEVAERPIAVLEDLGASGLDLGASYEARARVAIAMRDQDDFERFARRCAEQFRAGHNPILTVRYERLLDDARRAGLTVSRALTRAGTSLGVRTSAAASRAYAVLEGCESPTDRAKAMLRCLVEESASSGGLLYTMQKRGPEVSAAFCEDKPPANLAELVGAYLSAELESAEEVTASTASESATVTGFDETWMGSGGARFSPFLLSHVTQDGYTVTGLAVLCAPASGKLTPPAELLPVFSQALADAGDVVEAMGAS